MRVTISVQKDRTLGSEHPVGDQVRLLAEMLGVRVMVRIMVMVMVRVRFRVRVRGQRLGSW